MSRTFQVTDGTTTISLLLIMGIIPPRGGFGGVQLDRANLAGDILSGGEVAESFKLNIIGTSHDNIASQARALVNLLRKAQLYWTTKFQTTPVYLVQQTTGETNARYALVKECYELRWVDVFNHPFEIDNYVENFGLTIIREHPWRSGIPGTLPTALTLTKTNGPVDGPEIDVGNLRTGVGLSHLYNYDASLGTFSPNLLDDPNHILNPGFETAGGGGADVWANWREWVGAGGAIADETVDVHGGTHAAKITSGTTPSSTAVDQAAITVVPGTAYTLSYWGHGDGTNAGRHQIWDNTNSANIVPLTSNEITGASYALVSISFTAPAGCVSIKPAFYAGNVNGGIAYFDDVSLVQKSVSLWSVAGATPAAGDIVYIGTNGDFGLRHLVIDIATAGVFTADVRIQAYISGAWTDLAAGAGYTIYPSGTPSDLFKSITRWVINVEPGANWQAVDINGQTIFWIRLLLNSVTGWTTTPVSHGTYTPYAIRKNYIELPSTAIGGDLPPKLALRLLAPAGGATSPVMGTPSKIIMAAKSRGLTNFDAYLGVTGSFPSGWANAYGTDAALTQDPSAPPDGYMASVSFATDSTMVPRVTLTGTAHLAEWIGRYAVFVLAQQIGGANGDTQIRLRTLISGSAEGFPSIPTPTVALASHDAGYEVIDLGSVTLPFGEVTASDNLAADLVFQILAERITGVSTLRLAALIFMPVDEWACAIEDPLSDIDTGSSALRGSTSIDFDGGILRNRTLKQIISGGVFYPAETWNRDGPPPRIEPGKQTRIYFLMMHYPAAWGTGPMMAPAGMHLAVRVYSHDQYNTLRGSD